MDRLRYGYRELLNLPANDRAALDVLRLFESDLLDAAVVAERRAGIDTLRKIGEGRLADELSTILADQEAFFADP